MASGGESREQILARLVAANTRPRASDEERAVHRLILDAAIDPARRLTAAELGRVPRHIAGAGFDPLALERARGNLVGATRPNGGRVQRGERLPPGEVHYLRHVVVHQEWPPGTTLNSYFVDAERIIRDPASAIFASLYQGVWQCGAIGRNGPVRGPDGQDWIIVDYRLATGFWTTAFQWSYGPAGLADPGVDQRRESLRWFRQHRSTP
jgi:hypothetical protein